MPESGSRVGVYEAIGGVALLFMVLGIAIGVMQWMALAKDPTPVPRGIDPPSKSRLSIERADVDADADTDGAGAPAAGDAPKPDKAPKGDEEPPANGGEEDMEF